MLEIKEGARAGTLLGKSGIEVFGRVVRRTETTVTLLLDPDPMDPVTPQIEMEFDARRVFFAF